MLVLPILTVQEVKDWTANSELESLCETNPNKVSKYINNLSWMIWTNIDKEQFKLPNEDTYVIPDDLKFATINLLDIYYDYVIVNHYDITWRKISHSEKIDDYQITEWYNQYENTNQKRFLGVPISDEILAVFRKYMREDWFINVNIH